MTITDRIRKLFDAHKASRRGIDNRVVLDNGCTPLAGRSGTLIVKVSLSWSLSFARTLITLVLLSWMTVALSCSRRQRCIVLGCYRNGHGCCCTSRLRVTDLIGENVRTGKVRLGAVNQDTGSSADRHCPAQWLLDDRKCGGIQIIVNAGVVLQNCNIHDAVFPSNVATSLLVTGGSLRPFTFMTQSSCPLSLSVAPK